MDSVFISIPLSETKKIQLPCFRKRDREFVMIDELTVVNYVLNTHGPLDTVMPILQPTDLSYYFQTGWVHSTEEEYFLAILKASEKVQIFIDAFTLKSEYKNSPGL